ncbi:S1 family peptidase [Ruegeria faecimaris]|uniref:S1 family peptidase n=1 Tax=Ruegeria faecimaris TaxID=686389 RepID=UPI00248FCE10|nr:serine protease [Ruegeria faecimaris]
MVNAAHIRIAIRKHEPIVRHALTALFPDPDDPVNYEAVEESVDEDIGETLADVLLEILVDAAKVKQFLNFLRARGADPVPRDRNLIFAENIARFDGTLIGTPANNSFDFAALGDFAPRAESFRCQIWINNTFEGSGAFVAPNLVLTAAHVLDPLNSVPAGVDPRLEILASDEKRYRAKCVKLWPYHDSEKAGNLPPGDEVDIALLRIFLPLGHTYGSVDVTGDPPDFEGADLFTLVHYPEGVTKGFMPGKVHREPGAKRFPHDIDTSGGSSGGPGFDSQFRFLGIHQGKWETTKRLVPFEQFHDDPDFQDLISKNSNQRDMWSLSRDIDGTIIIGRNQFVTGLAHMLDHPKSKLRGIWIRREDTTSIRGLGFSYDMLESYLLMQEAPNAAPQHRCIRLGPTLNTDDLLADLAEKANGTVASPDAAAGTTAAQTTDVAFEGSRAETLIADMDLAAQTAGQTWWIYFDNPPEGLSPRAQVQFEHIAKCLPTSENLRLILAGYETYRLSPLRFANVGAVDGAQRSGLLVEELGPFTRSDVEATLNSMITSLDPAKELTPAARRAMVDSALAGLSPDNTGEFDGEHLETVVTRVRQEAKRFLEIEE